MAVVEVIIRATTEGLEAVKSSTRDFGSFKKQLTQVAAVGAGVAAMAYTLKKAMDFGAEGAKATQTAASFGLLMDKVGATPTLLEDLKQASRGTIAELDLMASTATLLAGVQGELATEMVNAAPAILEIAKAANKLNPALGSVEFQYRSLMTGIKRGSKLIIDNTGLTVDLGVANEDYAASIGKTVKQLDENEKKLALLYATQKAGLVLIDQVGGSVDSATDSYEAFTAAAKDARSEFSKAWHEYVQGTGAMEQATEGLRATTAGLEFENLAREMEHLGLMTKEEVKAARAYIYEGTRQMRNDEARSRIVRRSAEVTQEYTEALKQHDFTVRMATQHEARRLVELHRTESATREVTDAVEDHIHITERAEIAQYKLAKITEDDRLKMQDWGDVIQATDDYLADLAATSGDFFSEALGVAGATSDLNQEIGDLTEKLEKLNKNQGAFVEVTASTNLELLEAQVATQRLAEAEQRLADNTDPEKQAQLALTVERARIRTEDLTGALTDAHSYFVDNSEAIETTQAKLEELQLEKAALDFYNMADAAEADAVELALLAGALGLYDDEQLEAALNAATLQIKMEDLAQAYADGEISAGEAKAELIRFKAAMDAIPESKVVTLTIIEHRKYISEYLETTTGGETLQHGAWDVPHTGPRIIHAGEMVVPAGPAEAIRQGRGGSSVRIDNLNLYASDASPHAVAGALRGGLEGLEIGP